MDKPADPPSPARPIRWWPAGLILLAAIGAIAWIHGQTDWPFQRRNLETAKAVAITMILLLVWWSFFSRAVTKLRLAVTFGAIGLVALVAALFRLRGVSGDLVPILEFRWHGRPAPATTSAGPVVTPNQINSTANASFPQFYGPERNGILPGPKLEANWAAHPPAILWRQTVGPARSGFAVVGNLALTQEQRGESECVAAYDLATGKQLWLHADPAHYHTVIAGNGPHATPTVVSNRVFTLGGTGLLNCLELGTGKVIWQRNVVAESGGKVPEWGGAGSPLVANGLVIVHGGEGANHSLFAFHLADGKPVWSGGAANPSYASPTLATLAETPQILAFNHRLISSHDPATGQTLWEKTWGNGNVVCSQPVVVGGNRVLFSSGYGFGAELLEISRTESGKFSARLVWKSVRMKAKFAHLFARAGFLYGLDDGVFACVDLQDGSQRWKEGRYGHGQGLVVGELYLLMAEAGELVLLRPTSEAANELARFRVFNAKTWNPIALAGDLLLVRDETEAACLRLAVTPDTP